MSISRRILGSYRREIARNDAAISPIIATILLIAATVVLGATIYAATTGFGSKTPQAGTDASFRAAPFDSDGNGLSDTIRITYLQGPPDLDVNIGLTDSAGDALDPADGGCTEINLDVGDSCVVDTAAIGAAGRYIVTITVGGAVVLDTGVAVEESI